MPENTTKTLEQTQSVGDLSESPVYCPLSPEDLARDFASNPSSYHESMHPHIDAFLGRHALVANPETHEVTSSRSLKQLLDLVNNDKSTDRLTVYDAYKLIDEGYIEDIVRILEKFTGLDRIEIAKKLIDEGCGEIVAYNLEIFTSFNAEIALKLIDARYGYVVAENLENFNGLDHVKIAEKLIDIGDGCAVAENLENFNGLDHVKIAHKLIDDRYSCSVADNLEKFNSKNTIVQYLAAKSPHNLMRLSSSLLKELSGDRDLSLKFSDHQFYISILPKFQHDKAFDAYLRLTDEKNIPELAKTREIFGVIKLETAQLVCSVINDPEIGQQARAFGVTDPGEAGSVQLKQIVSQFVGEYKSGRLSPETESLIERSSILRSMLIDFTGYSETGWGQSSNESLARKIIYYNQAARDGRISPLDERYRPSDIFQVATVDSKKVVVGWTSDVFERYRTLYEDIEYSVRLARGENGGINQSIKDLRAAVQTVLGDLQQQINIAKNSPDSNAKKIENLENRRQRLDNYVVEIDSGQSAEKRYVMNSPADFAHGFDELSPYSELHGPMRRLIFTWAMRKHPAMLEAMQGLGEDVTIDSLASMRDFIEHTVNQETYGEYFAGNKKIAKRFKQLSSTRALKEAMSRYQEQIEKSEKKVGLQFIPTRGVLMEMSGQIASACWADRYDSIAETFPNFSAMLIRHNPGEEDEAIVGAAMLIETLDTETNEKMLLLRGLNPQETYINRQVDVEDFYQAVVEYVSRQALAIGAKPAIVIDGHSAGSCTNRPLLFGYLRGKVGDMTKVPVGKGSTMFNRYDVTRNSYLLEGH